MKNAFFGPIILAFSLFFILLVLPNQWIESVVSKSHVQHAATELNPLMFQGVYVQKEMLKDKTYLPIYGSSELSRLDQFHPANYFKVNHDGFTPF